MAYGKVIAAIDPLTAQPRRAVSRLKVGGRSISDYIGGYFDFDPLQPFKRIVKCLAYPDIKDAMYKPLADIATRLLVPNIDLIPQNSLSILRSSTSASSRPISRVNVEFGSELLWRNTRPTSVVRASASSGMCPRCSPRRASRRRIATRR